jgi:TrmH family RNA methyltransferase
MEPIRSSSNERFKALVEASKDKNLLLLEGRRLVEDALKRNLKPVTAAVTPDYITSHGVPQFDFTLVSNELFLKLTETKTPQGIAAFIPRPMKMLKDIIHHDNLIILDGLQDPGNVGTIVRTAETFGFGGIIITPGTASPFSGKAFRASMGSALGIDITSASVKELSSIDHKILALTIEGGDQIKKDMFSGRFAICLGQEGSGISEGIVAISVRRIYIPMKGRTESLNVAIAAGIVLAMAAGVSG